ncbi:MAG: hypothetical protein K2K42_00075, partial [Eubacterium sp.]|nr:hypothetical protein [Eubacterium sp.]
DYSYDVNFNDKCNQMWIYDGFTSLVYRVDNPEKVLKLFESIKSSHNTEQNSYKEYYYSTDTNEFVVPRIKLYDNKTFQLQVSTCARNFTYCAGDYEIKDNRILFNSYGGNFYSFQIADNGLIFDAKHSNEIAEYTYFSKEEDIVSDVPNSAFFELEAK